eukprot:gnl/Spiro4/27713_TR13809_c0_g1_i1.p1 gnl/Spiro4/27713_TR13809_c0_g1~~gnl/Spiro4/27713_TR13809_c0_g1_i1.p1  ORF type:complete len:307 (-),score=53.64 gnl/Spiro4/27713_TR13809_c0_g1_i1:63-947(-)
MSRSVPIDPARITNQTESVHGDIKTVVIEYTNDKGQKCRRTTQMRMKVNQRITPTVLARKSWKKFGLGSESQQQTAQIDQEVHFEKTRQLESDHKEEVAAVPTKINHVTCRNCGSGEHWTARCPLPRKNEAELNAAIGAGLAGTAFAPAVNAPASTSAGGSSLAQLMSKLDTAAPGESVAHGNAGDKYVAPSRRPGADASAGTVMRNREGYTLRISNLSEDTQDEDLYTLCSPFGQVSRVYLVRDKTTQTSRGFAFVSFHRQEEAELAMKGLDGHGYGYLILKVEWAKPSTTGS